MNPTDIQFVDLDGDGANVDPTIPTATEILRTRGNFGLGRSGEDFIVVFKSSTGKGSGAQQIPGPETDRFRRTLRDLATGGGAAAEAGYVPSWQRLIQSFKIVSNPGQGRDSKGNVKPAPYGGRDWYQWNIGVGSGEESKGAKPAKVPVDEMEDFLLAFDEMCDKAIARMQVSGVEQVGLEDIIAEAAATLPSADEDPDVDTDADDDGTEVDLDSFED